MESLLTYIVEKVLGPCSLKIERLADDFGGVTYFLELEDDKKPQIIGKGGRTITAIFNVLKSSKVKGEERIYLKIKD